MSSQFQVGMGVNAGETRRAPAARREAIPIPRPRARYDAAQSNSQAEHWKMADPCGPNAANNPAIRTIIRNRARYEIGNNSYAKGVVLTIANELIGRGPRLQMCFQDRDLNRLFEQSWRAWDAASGFSEKLHVFVQSKVGDGEGVALIINNPTVRHQVKLDILPIEPEMLTTPVLDLRANAVDGIVFDNARNPVEYHVLKEHPGEINRNFYGPNAFIRIRPENMLHWYRVDRPGQARGVSELTPCLNLFAQLRRWTLAVLTGAETAANFAALLTTNSAVDIAEQQTLAKDWEEIQIAMGAMVTIPPGYKMEQFKPNQPTSTYSDFKRELLKEIARALNMPYNVVAGDSSAYNYASGRLDYQNWHRAIRIARASLERRIIEHIFRAWVAEAVMTVAEFAAIDPNQVPHNWFFDAVQHVDPVKDGLGDEYALTNNTDTLRNICAAQGLDYVEVLEQRKIERDMEREFGLLQENVQPIRNPAEPPQSPSKSDPSDPTDDEEDQPIEDEAGGNRLNGYLNGHAITNGRTYR